MSYRFEQGLAAEVRGMSRAVRVWNLAAAVLLVVAVGSFALDRLILPSTVQATWAELKRERPGTTSSSAEMRLASRSAALTGAASGAG